MLYSTQIRAATKILAMEERHLTVDGFVVHEGRVAQHWHRKNCMWLPAGGHLEPGEVPLSAALREIREEFSLEAEVLPLAPRVDYDGGPAQIEPPFTILDCLPESHISLVYLCRLVSGFPGRSHDPDYPIVWLEKEKLEAGSAVVGGRDVAFAPDVLSLALEAIRHVQTIEGKAVAG